MGVRDFAKQRNGNGQNTRSSELTGVRAFAANKYASPNLHERDAVIEKRAVNAAALISNMRENTAAANAVYGKQEKSKVKETMRAGNPAYNDDYVSGVDYPKFRTQKDIDYELSAAEKHRAENLPTRYPEAAELTRKAVAGDAAANEQLQALAAKYAEENDAYGKRIAELKREKKNSKNEAIVYRKERAAKSVSNAAKAYFDESNTPDSIDAEIENATANSGKAVDEYDAQLSVLREKREKVAEERDDLYTGAQNHGNDDRFYATNPRGYKLHLEVQNLDRQIAELEQKKNEAEETGKSEAYRLRGAKTLASLPQEAQKAILIGATLGGHQSYVSHRPKRSYTRLNYATGEVEDITRDEWNAAKSEYNAAIEDLRNAGVPQEDIDRMITAVQYSADEIRESRASAELAGTAISNPGMSALTSAASVVLNLSSGLIAGVGEVGRAAGNAFRDKEYQKPMNTYGAAYTPVRATNDIRGTIAERVEEGNGKAGKVGSFAYQTLMSTADSVVSSVLGNVGGAAAIGGSAYASAIVDAKDKGETDAQALATGIAAGIFETLFERVSIGNFNALKEVPPATMRDVAKNVVKSTVVNASEEAATEIANIIADSIIGGDFSGYAEAYNGYLAAGSTPSEAKQRALIDMAKQVGMAALGGAVQGGMMGGIGTTWGYFANRDANRAIGELLSNRGGSVNAEVAAALVKDGANSKNEDVRRYAKSLEGKKVDSREAGQLVRMIAESGTQANNLQAELERRDTGANDTVVRTESDIRGQLGNADNADAVAAALYRMQSGDVSEADAETVRSSAEGRELFSAYFDANISESSTTERISEVVRDAGIDKDFHNLSYEAQALLKKVREERGNDADAEFYAAYFAGRMGKEYSGTGAVSLSAYAAGAEAREDIGTFRTVGGASISKETADMMQRAAKSLGISITYGGKGGLVGGAVRRGYMNAYDNIHIYEDAKVRLTDGTVLSGGDAAAQIILGHELTHVLQKQAPDAYRALEKYAAAQTEDYEGEIARRMAYSDLTRQEAIDEFTADYSMRTLFADAKTAREVTQKHSKLAEAIRNAIAWIREHVFHQQDANAVDRAAKIWNDAYNEARRNKSSTADTGSARNSVAIDNRAPVDYNAFDEALDRRQWAQFYSDVSLREESGEIAEGVNFYFTESGAPKLVIFRYDSSAKNKAEVIAAYRSDSALDDAIIKLKEEYAHGQVDDFNRKLYRCYEEGKLQHFDSDVRGYSRVNSAPGKATDVFGQNGRIGETGKAGRRDSQSSGGNNPGVAAQNNRINKEAGSNESAFSVGAGDNQTRCSTTADDIFAIAEERKRGTYSSVVAGLRQQESDARKAKQEFLPDTQTLGDVARSLAEMGLADGVTREQLGKAVQDAAVAMRAAYMERHGADAKARKRTAAVGKLLAAARMLAPKSGVTVAETAEAISEALYQTSKTDRKTVKQLVEEYGAIKPGEKPSRVVSVPRKTDKNRDVSKAVRTVMEARITPETMLPTIEDAIESGDFSYETVTDKASSARARKAVKENYQSALDKYRENARRGVVSKDNAALGFELYNQAVNANTDESRKTALDILTDMVASSRSSAQALQAMRMIKKMSPDYQLYSVERLTQKMNEDLSKQNLKKSGAKKSVEDAILAGQEDARSGVAKEVGELGNGVPVEKWVETVGDIVADGIAARLSGETDANGKTVPQTMRADLAKLANELLPQKTTGGKVRTVVDRVSDYFANQSAYEEAWQTAKKKLTEKYGSDADSIGLLDALLATTRALSDAEIDKAVAAAVREVGANMSEIIRSDARARGEALRAVQNLLIQSGIDEADAKRAADIIAERFSALTEEKSREALEQILADKPRGIRKTAEEKFTEYANLGAFEGEYNAAIAEKLFGAPVKVNEKLAKQFREAETKAAREEILKEIYRDIGSQIPSTFTEKFTAWRYISMLVNPQTHIRNIVGNAGFAPMLMLKNKVAALLEMAAIRDKSQRTKSFAIRDSELVKAAGEDFTRMGDALFQDSKYKDEVNANQYIAEGRKTFSESGIAGGYVGKALNKLQKFNGDLLSSEDMLFKRQYYVYALSSYCKARGITAEQIRSGKGLDSARAYAIREAQRATYNDANAFSDFLSRRSGNKFVDTTVSFIVPFRRTPANILARGFEYSPLGLLKSITYDLARVSDGRISAAEAIDNIAAGITGSAVAGLGALLAYLGFIKVKGFDGGDEDKERKFEEMYGHQQYSIEIFDKSITLDWLAPESIPFFTGVNIYEAVKDGGLSWNDVLDVIALTTDPAMNMSMLQGVNSILSSAKYSTLEATAAIAYQIAENAISQSIPTLFGKLERISQPDRMTTYVDKNSAVPRAMQRTLGKLSQKIPGLDYGQIPYISAWGEKETNDSAAWRAFDQLINPAYTATVTETPLEKELIRLSKDIGEKDVFPTRAATYFNVKKLVGKDAKTGEDVYETVRVDLTAQQYVNYAQAKGKTSKRICEELINTSYYKNATNEQKYEMVKNAYSYANSRAKALVSKYEPTGWEAKAIEVCSQYGISDTQFIAMYTLSQDMSGKLHGETVTYYSDLQKMRMLYETSLTDEQRDAVADALGVGKTVKKMPKERVLKKIESIEEDE